MLTYRAPIKTEKEGKTDSLACRGFTTYKVQDHSTVLKKVFECRACPVVYSYNNFRKKMRSRNYVLLVAYFQPVPQHRL